MQTIQLQVKDGYTQNILDMLGSVKGIMIEKIEVKQDKSLELDPYFYERQKQLHHLRVDIRNGKEKMYDSVEWDIEMQKLEKELDAL